MNCAECRENLVACAEGLLSHEELLRCEKHLETCAACRAEYTSISHLQRRLVARGQAAAEVSVIAPVMRRVHAMETEKEGYSFMAKLIRRWRFGLSAAAGAAAIALVFLLISSKTQATAAEIMAKGAKAVARLTSIHLRGQLRTAPQDNFAAIMPDHGPVTIELWKQFEPELKWRVEKPGRVAVMDGKSTLLFIKPANLAMKFPKPSPSAFDTQWLHELADLSETLETELRAIKAHGWPVTLTQERGDDGKMKSVITVEAKSGLPDSDYLKNKFFMTADTRRVYTFDDQSELLESVKVYLHRPSGDQLVFAVNQIDYNQPIDPGVFKLELPPNVNWYQTKMQKLPGNQKYASMTAEQAARAFFEACGKEDWNEAQKFERTTLDDRAKKYLGGLTLVSLGRAFTSKGYDPNGRFVPYEIKLPAQEFSVRVSNANPAHRYVITGVCDNKLRPVQDLTWTNEPLVLPENEVYAKLSPTEAVKAYFAAASKFDWGEMRKFAPDYDVEKHKLQFEAARKQGVDVHNLTPVMETGEVFWSAEQSAWLVKCRAVQIKKWNLALKKDGETGRWFVDGGL